MADRIKVSARDITKKIEIRDGLYPMERTKKLYGNLAQPSYVHGYSLAIEYMYNWFESKFPKNYFEGGIYVDGKHVLDDYKHFSKNNIKAKNPRARMGITVDYDFDREGVDLYAAPAELYLRRSNFQQSFFKDYDNDMFLGMNMRALRMNFAFKVRTSTRAQQLEAYNRMEMYFRVGATQQDSISVDFHIPKEIILSIAEKAAFDIVDGQVVDIIEFLEYLNRHSDLPFLFKIRAINQQPEYFIRVNGLYTHIAVRDKLQLDDGETQGKLSYNFHVEMAATLTIAIPHFYAFYCAEDITKSYNLKERDKGTIAIYSINVFEVPKVDENGWIISAETDYLAEKGDTNIDLSSLFSGKNSLAQAVQHDLTNGVSPSRFINIKVYHSDDVAKLVNTYMDWKTKTLRFIDGPIYQEETLHIVLYYDREYINELDIELNKYNSNRIESKN